MTTTELFSKARELLAKATPGPWQALENPEKGIHWVQSFSEPSLPICETNMMFSETKSLSGETNGRNAEFIAFARNNLPAILDLCERQKRAIEVLLQNCKQWNKDDGFECGYLIMEAIDKAEAILEGRDE